MRLEKNKLRRLLLLLRVSSLCSMAVTQRVSIDAIGARCAMSVWGLFVVCVCRSLTPQRPGYYQVLLPGLSRLQQE